MSLHTGIDEPSAAQLAPLPAPVARYLAFALGDVRAPIREARIHWAGQFRLGPDAGWKPFVALQRYTTHPPGFVWDARIRMRPLLAVHVRDGYADGRGTMRGRIAGLVPVVNQGGTPEMAAGALTRWLGEAVWFPTALIPAGVPGEGVWWDAVDDATARATLTDHGTTVSADFHFGPRGELTAMSAMRYRDVDGRSVLTPFEGRYDRYAPCDGVRIPTSAEVAWLLPGGRFPYWRGRPVKVEYARGP